MEPRKKEGVCYSSFNKQKPHLRRYACLQVEDRWWRYVHVISGEEQPYKRSHNSLFAPVLTTLYSLFEKKVYKELIGSWTTHA